MISYSSSQISLQISLWKYLAGAGETSLAQMFKEIDIFIATLRQALLRLMELGKVKRTGRDPQTRHV